MTRPPRGHTAFTLVEVLTVLAILALISGIAAQQLSRQLDRLAVTGAITEAASALSRARDDALAQRTMVTVRIDTLAGTVVSRWRGRAGTTYALARSYHVVLSTTRDSIAFDARGLGYGAANFTLMARRARAADTLVVSRLGRLRY